MDETKQIIDLLRELVELQSITGRSSSSNTTNSFDDSWFKSYKKTIDDLKDTTQDLTKMSRSELEADKSLIEQKIKNGQLTKEEISVKLKLLEVAIKTRISEETKLEVTKKTVKSLNDFQKTLSEVNGDVSKFNKFIEGMGSGAESLIKNSVKLDTYGQKFGLEAGKLGTAVGVAVKALTSLTTVALDQTQKLLQAFDDLSEIGGTSLETAESVRKLGASAGYTVDMLPKFNAIVKNLGNDLTLLGASSNAGVVTFSKIASVGNKTFEAFNRVGISQEQFTEAQARFIKQSANAGTAMSKSPMALQKASIEYLETLVKLRDLHGISIKEQQDALDTARNNDNFNSYLMEKKFQRAAIEKQMEDERDPLVKKQLEQRAAEITQVIANKEAYATLVTKQYDAATAAALLATVATDGAPIITELNAKFVAAGRDIGELQNVLMTSKDVNAGIRFEQEENVKATRKVMGMFGELGYSAGQISTGLRQTFGLTVETNNAAVKSAELLTEAGRKRVAEEENRIKAEIERRLKEGVIVDRTGNVVKDGAKDLQNALLTVGRTVGVFKDDAIEAMNPFTKSTLSAATASTALMLAAGGAAGALTLLSGKKILGALGSLGRLIGIGGAGAPGAATAAGAGAAGAATAAGAGAAGAAAASRFGLLRGFLGKAALPLLAANTGYDLYKGFTADKEAGFGSKLFNAGSSALSGLTFGMLGSSPEEIKKRAEQQTGQSKISEGTTTTVESGGQKAVNVNVVQSVPLTVNIDKFLDPIFKLSRLGPQTASSTDSDITLADVNDKVTLPVKISAMSEGFETLFKSMNNHLFIIANKIESGVRGGTPGTSSTASGGGGAAANIVIPPISEGKPFIGSNKDFTDNMQKLLLEQAKKMNLANPEIIAKLGTAQSALETGYGKHLAGGNNYFGIKSKPGDPNASSVDTKEWDPVKQQFVTTKAGFRKYGSMEESAQDYIKFLLENPRYKDVLKSSSPEEAARAIQNSGYATDPSYETKIRSIMSRMEGRSAVTSVATSAVSAKVAATPAPVAATPAPVAATPAPVAATARPTIKQSSSESYLRIAGERFIPGQPLSRKQMAVIGLALSMGNTYPPEVMQQYNKQKNESVAPDAAIPSTPPSVAPSVPITNPKDDKPISPFADPESEFYSPNRNPESEFYDPAMMSDTMMNDDERTAYRTYLDKLNAWNEKQQGNKTNYASGGMILGPGTSTSDSVPAFNKDTGQPIALSTGEYVLPANVTSMLGKGYLDSLISSPNTLKRQKGGTIPGKGGKEIVSSNDLGEGMREVLYSDGSRTLSGGFGTRFFDSSGNLVKMTSPNLGTGVTQTVYPSGKQDLSYKEGPMSTSKTSSGRITSSYDTGIASFGFQNIDPRYAAMGLYSKDSSFSLSVPTGEKSVTKTFTGEEIAEMMKKQLNEGLVENALGNTATLIGDPMKEVLTPYLEKQEKTMGTLIDVFNKLFNEMERSNSTQSEILTYTRN